MARRSFRRSREGEGTVGGGGVVTGDGREGREGPKEEREGPRCGPRETGEDVEAVEGGGGAVEEEEGGEREERKSTGMRRFCCSARRVRCSAWNYGVKGGSARRLERLKERKEGKRTRRKRKKRTSSWSR
jgi:hypothetical protein